MGKVVMAFFAGLGAAAIARALGAPEGACTMIASLVAASLATWGNE